MIVTHSNGFRSWKLELKKRRKRRGRKEVGVRLLQPGKLPLSPHFPLFLVFHLFWWLRWIRWCLRKFLVRVYTYIVISILTVIRWAYINMYAVVAGAEGVGSYTWSRLSFYKTLPSWYLRIFIRGHTHSQRNIFVYICIHPNMSSRVTHSKQNQKLFVCIYPQPRDPSSILIVFFFSVFSSHETPLAREYIFRFIYI